MFYCWFALSSLQFNALSLNMFASYDDLDAYAWAGIFFLLFARAAHLLTSIIMLNFIKTREFNAFARSSPCALGFIVVMSLVDCQFLLLLTSRSFDLVGFNAPIPARVRENMKFTSAIGVVFESVPFLFLTSFAQFAYVALPRFSACSVLFELTFVRARFPRTDRPGSSQYDFAWLVKVSFGLAILRVVIGLIQVCMWYRTRHKGPGVSGVAGVVAVVPPAAAGAEMAITPRTVVVEPVSVHYSQHVMPASDSASRSPPSNGTNTGSTPTVSSEKVTPPSDMKQAASQAVAGVARPNSADRQVVSPVDLAIIVHHTPAVQKEDGSGGGGSGGGAGNIASSGGRSGSAKQPSAPKLDRSQKSAVLTAQQQSRLASASKIVKHNSAPAVATAVAPAPAPAPPEPAGDGAAAASVEPPLAPPIVSPRVERIVADLQLAVIPFNQLTEIKPLSYQGGMSFAGTAIYAGTRVMVKAPYQTSFALLQSGAASAHANLSESDLAAVAATMKHYDLKQFRAEMCALATVTHENIVPLLGVCEAAMMLVLPFIEGGDLHSLITGHHAYTPSSVDVSLSAGTAAAPAPVPAPAPGSATDHKHAAVGSGGMTSAAGSSGADQKEPPKQAPLPWVFKIDILLQIALGIRALHTAPAPLIHRDLKPNNILITGENVIKICDFGLARYLNESSATGGAPSAIATSHHAAGTTHYMSREQIIEELGVPLTRACDIYAFGGLIFFITAHRNPWTVENLNTAGIIVAVHNRERPKLPADIIAHSGVPIPLYELMLACLNHDARERPVIDSVIERLCDLQRSLLISAAPEAVAAAVSAAADAAPNKSSQ